MIPPSEKITMAYPMILGGMMAIFKETGRISHFDAKRKAQICLHLLKIFGLQPWLDIQAHFPEIDIEYLLPGGREEQAPRSRFQGGLVNQVPERCQTRIHTDRSLGWHLGGCPPV
jgi:hypothetical protein